MKRVVNIFSLFLLLAAVCVAGGGWRVRHDGSGGTYTQWSISNSNGHLLPGIDNTFNVGSNSFRAASIYGCDVQARNLHLTTTSTNATTTLTVASGAQCRIAGTVAGNITLTIPSAVVAGSGYVLDIQDVSGELDGSHTVTVNATAGNINGSATAALATAYGGMRLISNGTNWFKR